MPRPVKATAKQAHIVALSGGKDSTAMALRLREVEPREYVYVITPTGDELPEMLTHWRLCAEWLGTPLTPLTSGKSLQGLIRDFTALPNGRMRWCTRILKIEPFEAFLMQLAEQGFAVTSYVGLRADEPERQGGVYEKARATMRYPMREWGWGLREVWGYLGSRNITIPKRTDCGRCFWQRLYEWRELYDEHPAVYAEAEENERSVSEARGKFHTFRSKSRDTQPAGLAALRERFEAGYHPRRPEAASQLSLWGEAEQGHGCRVCSM